MKYIIMCGWHYAQWKTPKQLTKIGNERLVDRTIRLLREFGIEDIAITTNTHAFDDLDVDILWWEGTGRWLGGFYPLDEPICYLFGDIFYSKAAIQTIIQTTTDDIEFFASAPPFSHCYIKPHAEPFGFKVVNTRHFLESIQKTLAYPGWHRDPISWELWQVIKNTPYGIIDYTNYTVINDFTADIDNAADIQKLSDVVSDRESVHYMIHTYPKRLWYVEDYLIPSLITQGIEKSQISVYNDSNGDGNLRACMSAFAMCDGNGGTWHLQDDVIICKDFRERTEFYNQGLVCGFSSNLYDGEGRIGVVNQKDMWFSFPCIRIPNRIAKECSEWVTKYIIGNFVYEKFWKSGVNDDWAFRAFVQEFYKDEKALNLAPNLVDHIDYLLGGGSGKTREYPCRAQYWADDGLVQDLEKEINACT